MKANRLFFVFVVAYAFLIIPFTGYLKGRPFAEKLGYLPEAEALKLTVGDQRYLLAEWTVLRVMTYYGSLFEKRAEKAAARPEYADMSRMLATAGKLDPYNMDAYYFAQAAFTWEVGWARDVNKFLIYGMKYRSWDWYLPFFVGFNDAYFLKDYKDAAHYMQIAAKLSGEPLFANLAARYYYEAGLTDLGILFIDTMEKGAKDEKVRKLYDLRKRALLAVKTISAAVTRYREKYGGRLPADLTELVRSGILPVIPADPYGGTFYITDKGSVRSTSKFAFGGEKKGASTGDKGADKSLQGEKREGGFSTHKP